jgi:predicted anti-sigma-YlaC factor YlaD
MSKDKVNCKDVMHNVCESLGEDLNSDKCVAIKKHLEECPGCKSYFETIEITIDYYRKYNVKMPDDAHEKLMKFLDLDDCE